MKTATRNPERLLRAVALCVLAVTILACGSSTTPVPPFAQVQPTDARETAQAAIQADACYTGIIPGQATREDVIVGLGEPATVREESGIEFLGYPSYNSGQTDTFVIEAGRVVLIGKMLNPDDLSLSQLKELHGEPEQATFSYFMSGTRTYLYPQKGLVFIVEPESDLVFYQECVVPMSLDQYMSSWGGELPLEDPFNE